MYLVEQHFLSSLFPNRKPGRRGVTGSVRRWPCGCSAAGTRARLPGVTARG